MKKISVLTVVLSLAAGILFFKGGVYADSLLETEPLIKGADDCTVIKSSDSAAFRYKDFDVQVSPHEESNGYRIKVYSRKTGKTLTYGKEYGGFFQGIFNDCIIIDYGTGQIREVRIFNLQTGKQLFRHIYVGELKLSGKRLCFKDKVTIREKNRRPSCPKELEGLEYGIGYTEKMYFDMQKKTLVRTGNYECTYFE